MAQTFKQFVKNGPGAALAAREREIFDELLKRGYGRELIDTGWSSGAGKFKRIAYSDADMWRFAKDEGIITPEEYDALHDYMTSNDSREYGYHHAYND